MFIPYMKESGGIDAWELQPATASLALNVGTALALSSGKLVKATGTTAPTFICMEKVASTTTGQMVHVIRVQPDTIFESELSVASSSIAIGTKYTIAADGERVTATDTSGVAEIVSYDGKAAGDKVRVRF